MHVIVFFSIHTVPSGSPTILSVNVTTHLVLLRWSSVPQSQQNGNITGYVISVRTGGQQMHIQVTADHKEYTLEAAPHNEYVLNVAAVNSVGRGPFSSTRIVRTLEDGKCSST